MATMNLTRYAQTQGISTKTAQRWFKNGTLPHPARKVGRLILVDVSDTPVSQATRPGRTALYLSDPRSAGELKEWALSRGMRVDETCREDDLSSVLRRLLADQTVTRIVTDSHPAADLLSAALSAQGREFITVAPHTTFTPRIASSAGA
ncbi:recombinase family protein [Gordonia sp. PDNC005]|uniref:recombinase family protein n=1 Tax=unclassified Gordonia (in: high G+C Gram-positive bacteria) TaxID=2657482 RepID=UPI0019649C04|nr:recombinase family protein [Gordonia sp. PDNC005]QRY62294.1 recombinase family protein [Gordonia sp. PDNC005]